jgi:WD40 repeat protein
VASARRLREIPGRRCRLTPLALSPDGRLLAVVDEQVEGRYAGWPERFVRLVNPDTGVEVSRLVAPPVDPSRGQDIGITHVAFSPDGKTVATVGAPNARVRLWDLATRRPVREFTDHLYVYLSCTFSPDGKTLAAADAGEVRLRDVATGNDVARTEGHLGSINSVALTPDGKTLVTAGEDRTLRVWDLATGRPVRRVDAPAVGFGHLVLSADSQTAYVSLFDGTVRAWDLTTGRESPAWARTTGIERQAFRQASLMAASPDRKVVAASSKRGMLLLDVATGRELRLLKPEGESWRLGATFLPDGRTLVVWTGDHEAEVWDWVDGRRLRQFPFDADLIGLPAMRDGIKGYVYRAAVSPDGRFLAATRPGGSIQVFEVATGQEVLHLKRLKAGVGALAFSPDGATLAWGGGTDDPTIHLTEVATGRERHALTGHFGPVRTLNFSADGTTLVSTSEDSTALAWDLTGRRSGRVTPLAAPADLDVCWADLAGDDAGRAFQAIRRLTASPDLAVPLLARHLQPVAPADEPRVARLIADLDSRQFEVRERASRELDRVGELAVGLCRKALAGQPTDEVRRRLEALLDKHAPPRGEYPSAERRRILRSIEVLEWSESPAARPLLTRLAGGADGAYLTEQARAALRRGR